MRSSLLVSALGMFVAALVAVRAQRSMPPTRGPPFMQPPNPFTGPGPGPNFDPFSGPGPGPNSNPFSGPGPNSNPFSGPGPNSNPSSPSPSSAPPSAVINSPSAAPSGSCASIRTRYECRELADTALQAVFAAFKRLKDTNAFDKFVDWHVSVTNTAHGVPEFLPWHREFLRRLEIELGVDICYWDWASDAQVPEASPFLMAGWGGTNSGPGNCVSDSFWGSYQYKGECVSTQWDGSNGGIGAFYSIDYVAKLITDNNSYDPFRVAYEGTAHARIHNGIGGTFSKMTSPANPVFFFHHANVDRHWAVWQWVHPDKKTDYPKSLSTMLSVFNIPVSQTMDTEGPGYCYTYSNLDMINTGRAQIGLLQRRAAQDEVSEEEPRELDRSDHLVRLHRRTGCGNTDSSSNYVAPPCDEDRTNLVDLREVRPAPEWWIKMEGLNCTEVRLQEADHMRFINALNRIPGYVSPSALYNRPTLLEHVVKNAPAEAQFYIYKPGSAEKVHVFKACEALNASLANLVHHVRQEVRKAYPVQSFDDILPALDKVMGCDLAKALVSVGNQRANRPYVPVPVDEDDAGVCPAGYDFIDNLVEDRHRNRDHRRNHRRNRRHDRHESHREHRHREHREHRNHEEL